jgi:Pyrroline-5-carboxylate reductase
MLRFGFVGTGVLAEAVIDGLQAEGAERYAFHLSPRSEERSRRLAAAYANITREESNEAVVAASDIVVLGVLPQQIAGLQGLPFRTDQIVVSLLAGTALDLLRPIVRPSTRLVRVIPLPSIRLRKGPIVMSPGDAAVEALFRGLGDLIVLDRESDLAATGVASGLMSSYFQLQNVAVDWLRSRGLPDAQASIYMRSLFAGLAEVALATDRAGEPLDPGHHETRGGLNERGRAHLMETGWFDRWSEALDIIEAHGRTLSKGGAQG